MAAVLALALGAGCPTAPSATGDGGAPPDFAHAGDGGRPCLVQCTMGFTCCDGSCVNLRNDIHNCGACGVTCTGTQPFCNGMSCAPAPCSPACTGSQLCCNVDSAGPSRGPACTDPTDGGTCPLGCPLCL
jgi:hypothetical protein